MEYFFAQAVGAVGLVLLVVLFHSKSRKRMLRLQLIASVFYALHFLLLGAVTGAALNGATIARNYVFAQKESSTWAKSRWWLYVFIAVYCVLTAVTWQGPISILPALGMVSGTVAFWCSKPATIRLISLISPPLWFMYNFAVGSYPGMVTEVFVFISILAAIIRLDIAPSVAQSRNKLM